MKYKNFEITENKNNIIIENVKDFEPKHIFECGQCFRWVRENDGSYSGTAMGHSINVSYSEGRLKLENANIQDFKDIWYSYFDLERDYSLIKEKLRKDEVMNEAINFGYGIRLLKQDIWETLISFILSANNRIPMIMRAVSNISKSYGCEILCSGKSDNAFPPAHVLADTDITQLDQCKCGYRSKYVLNTSALSANGVVDLKLLADMDTDTARKSLLQFPGVGPKVADCVLLYSGTKYDVFPTDVWVKRVMEVLYFKRKSSFKEINEFAKEYFGDLAGFAQQYLFYYARENKIGS